MALDDIYRIFLKSGHVVFAARRYSSAVYAVAQCLSVRSSVKMDRHNQSGTTANRKLC